MPNLKWDRLKENKCPKCRSFLEPGDGIIQCHNKKCGFFIDPLRMQQIVNARLKAYEPPRYSDYALAEFQNSNYYAD